MYQSDLNHPDQTLEEKLNALYVLNRAKDIDLSFRPPFLNLLEKFGNPHLELPPVIHVAGTNGKGSVLAMLRSIFEAAGLRVNVYTSPHLMKFNERIVLAGEEIPDGALEDLIDEALELNDGGDLTFFEITTAMAFAAFSRTDADVCLLEVGMGGRLDCTNVVEVPLLTIINQIGLDHTEHLGETYKEIAAEKAGIMKAGCPCVIGLQSAAGIEAGVLDVFESKAEELALDLHYADMDEGMDVGLTGVHQQANAAAVLKALEVIKGDFPVDEQGIAQGLSGVRWRGRLQKIQDGEDEIWLDGGHNLDAARALAAQCEVWAKEDSRPLYVIMAMMKGKDAAGFIGCIGRHAEGMFFTGLAGEPNIMEPKDLQAIHGAGEAYEDLGAALEALGQKASPKRILICGSLYLAGDVLKRYS